ncbi:MAG TPA: 6-phosphogluconolactonase [Candidatus Binatia bacterium]|jgi:6-phosphogluconolactonase|nr:6-phosphogluconolactonase [Candidatus Binatia bacterium]
MPEVEVCADGDALMTAAAETVVRAAAEAIEESGRFTLALSGGTTPKRLFQLLATPGYAARIDWAHVYACFGDERCVPPNDPASNYRMAREALLDRVPIPPEQVLRMRGEDDPVTAAADYERALREVVGNRTRLDLVLLGMGDNGHTASLFPGMTAVHEHTRWVVAEHIPEVGMWRITLTPAAINAAAEVVFLVSGAGKAPILARVLEGPRQPDVLPSQVVAPTNGTLRWLVDAAAAAQLKQEAR